MLHQRRAGIPWRIGRVRRDVIALEARDRQRGERLDADGVGKGGIFGHDLVKTGLIIIDQIHLVDRQHDVADANQLAQIGMPPRLHQHALARIDQDHGEIGGRGAGDHVARILLMAGAVRHDEFALFGVEEAIGNVNRDALLALGGEAIDQQREVDLLPLRARFLAVSRQRIELIFKDHLAVIEQAPDQRRFAIVHRPAGDEAQHGLVLMLVEIAVDILGDQAVDDVNRFVGDGFVLAIGHQKYPCCFLTSMPAPPESLSMARPCRSDVVVSKVS